MGNFFKDNPDLMFTLEHLDLAPVAELVEHGYKNAEEFDYAPENFADALDNYRQALKVVGEIAAQIREKRPPEPYLGKGVKYSGEKIRRKAGKTGK